MFKKFISLFYSILIVILAAVAAITAFSVIPGPKGLRFFVVLSGSMEPKIHTASVVLVASQDKYKKDDVITFLANPKAKLKDANATVTHRVVNVKDDEGRRIYETKGDANNAPDRETVAQSSILGKVMFSIPYLGKLIAFTKTQTGFILFIVIPSTLIIYSELTSIKNEIAKMFKRKKEKTEEKRETP